MNFKKLVSWDKENGLSEEDRIKISALVNAAHEEGIKTRFWATPNEEALWKELLELGVNWINVDDLAKYRLFFIEGNSQ